MHWLTDLRLFLFTAGTLLPFFWMVVILGHRRQRNFERVFFFLSLSLTAFFGGLLLALNSQLFYGTPREDLLRFAWTVLAVGLWTIPSLLLHLNFEYAALRDLLPSVSQRRVWLAISWLPAFLLLPRFWPAILDEHPASFSSPVAAFGWPFLLWLLVALSLSFHWQLRFHRAAPNREQRSFHFTLAANFLFLIFLLILLTGLRRSLGAESLAASLVELFLLAAVVFPLAALVLHVERFNFLQIGRQRNLIFAVFAVFLALLYLSFVRRAGLWLEPYLPPEATAALLLFLPVVFFEPLQRRIRNLLQKTAQAEIDRVQRMIGPINDVARRGDAQKLRAFAEKWIAGELQLAEVSIALSSDASSAPAARSLESSSEERFALRRGADVLGHLRARSHGAMLSGETYAALELLAEQLPASFDLCRLIEEKLALERELAVREKLALVGQMAASISHNLKNPLGSIKTILQVQLENADLPPAIRPEIQMVLGEINRLSDKLNQLLQFSRPALLSSPSVGHSNLSRIAENIVGVLRAEAESRGISLQLFSTSADEEVAAGPEAVNDILSNLVLNALEAAPSGGRVHLSIGSHDGHCRVTVEDNGPGIPPELRARVLEPFFTTKARGTGLGLAIVSRRVEEAGGTIQVESPIHEGKGTRFLVTLPFAAKETSHENHPHR